MNVTKGTSTPTRYKGTDYRSKTEATFAAFLEIVAPHLEVDHEPDEWWEMDWHPDFEIASFPEGDDKSGYVSADWIALVEVKATEREAKAVTGKLEQAWRQLKHGAGVSNPTTIWSVSTEGLRRGRVMLNWFADSTGEDAVAEMKRILTPNYTAWKEAVRRVGNEGISVDAPPAPWIDEMKERQARRRRAEECTEEHDWDDEDHQCPSCGGRKNCAYRECYDCASR